MHTGHMIGHMIHANANRSHDRSHDTCIDHIRFTWYRYMYTGHMIPVCESHDTCEQVTWYMYKYRDHKIHVNRPHYTSTQFTWLCTQVTWYTYTGHMIHTHTGHMPTSVSLLDISIHSTSSSPLDSSPATSCCSCFWMADERVQLVFISSSVLSSSSLPLSQVRLNDTLLLASESWVGRVGGDLLMTEKRGTVLWNFLWLAGALVCFVDMEEREGPCLIWQFLWLAGALACLVDMGNERVDPCLAPGLAVKPQWPLGNVLLIIVFKG